MHLQALEREAEAPPHIYIGFSTTGIWLSRLIRWGSHAKVSHCWVRHDSEVWGGTWVTQADWPVLRQWPWAHATKGWTYLELYRPKVDLRPAFHQLRDEFEEHYGALGLVGVMLALFVKRYFHRRIRNPLARPREVFCSEFVAKIFITAGLVEEQSLDPELATPEQLRRFCEKRTDLFEKVSTGPVPSVPEREPPVALVG